MLKQYHYTSLSYKKIHITRWIPDDLLVSSEKVLEREKQHRFSAHLHFSTRIFRFSTRIFDFRRASSIFYAHLQHDQDFPSDTRPRDDPASRLAPGHALVPPPFGLTVATPVAGPLQSCLSSRLPPPSDLLHLCVSGWVIRFISWKHRVPYFPFDPWGIVTIIQ